MVYSNFTPRANNLSNLPFANDKVVFFGLQYFMKDFLINCFNDEFFNKPKRQVVAAYKRRMDNALGKDAIPVDHIEALHDLGYLPLEINALPEGTLVDIRVPMFTIHNTHPDFFWLVNYIESVISATLWKPCVTATTAYWYKRLFDAYADETGGDMNFAQFQGHDFAFRGMSGAEDAAVNAAAHLLSFVGTDSVLGIDFHEEFYGADSDKYLLGCSVPATEHSVMCMGGKATELETFDRLLKTYSKGILSVVSDTWDYWGVLTKILPKIKDKIMARDGKLVIRPDSGNPVHIICGDPDADRNSVEYKGSIEVLYDEFGGTVNEKGFKQLDPHIGLIYGDSITPSRAVQILFELKEKGFCSTNVVLGIGSFTYQYVTRDTYGFAVKSTYGEINGEGQIIQKDPKTDSGTKKSAQGLLRVIGGKLYDNQKTIYGGDMSTVFKDGKILITTNLVEIRERLNAPEIKAIPVTTSA